MKLPALSLKSIGVITLCCAAAGVEGCSANVADDTPGNGGGSVAGTGGSSAGSSASGGGGGSGSGTNGGAAGVSGGTSTTGGSASGSSGLAGAGQGGAHGGAETGGQAGASAGVGGSFGGNHGGTGAGGGQSGAGGNASGGGGGGSGAGGGSTTDPCSVTTVPTGGTTVQSSNKSGKAAGLDWTIWSNGSGGSITYYDVPAFSAKWNNSGDFLARIGLQWNATKTYQELGALSSQFNYKKSGTAGGFSYVGIYGWTVSPCVEWYIVDDSYNTMPVNPGNVTNKGMTDLIDGAKYNVYTRNTSGTGGSKCPGVNNWIQFYSIRTAGRQCGTISITKHFEAWTAAGMELGKMDQAQILVEVGGGVGEIDFSVANVILTPP